MSTGTPRKRIPWMKIVLLVAVIGAAAGMLTGDIEGGRYLHLVLMLINLGV